MDAYKPQETHRNSALLIEERQRAACVLTLNRPSGRNSLSLDLIAALHDAIGRAGAMTDVAAIIITGAPPAFCAGHDLKEITARRRDPDRGRAFFEQTMRSCCALMQSIIACHKPVIAAVNGIATAAGCQLVASCDLAVAGESAQFATPGVNIGLFCSTPMVALSRNISRKAAMEMLLLGDMVPAAKAKELGLVNWVVPDADLLSAAIEVADKIEEKSPLTLAIGKQSFYRQAEVPLAEAYDYTACVMVENMLARDAEEGIGAFLEKRTPHWTGS
jgi:enoyl-CoA hydratase/carnithine racemase